MDLLASYDDENTEENSVSNSPSNTTGKSQSNLVPNLLENEWLSFEQMIAPGGGVREPVRGSDFLVNGIVAYPGMKGVNTVVERGLHGAESTLALEEQSSASSDNETAAADKAKQDAVTADGTASGKKDVEDDDAFFKLRKQVKERDHSDSSDRSRSSGSSSASSSRSVSPSPPHLSPVNSIKSHTSEPPDLTAKDVPEDKVATGIQDDIKLQDKKKESVEKSSSEKRRSASKDRKRSRSRDRKRSHRDHRSKHDHSSSKSKRRRSRSRSKDRRHRRSSRDRHRHKDKKSRDRKSSRNDEKRSKSREKKENKSESEKSEVRDRKDSKSEVRTSESHDQTEVKKTDSHETKGGKSHRKRSRSRSRDKRDRRRSRSRHRHRSKSKDRRRSRSKERKRSKSRERRKKHRSRSRHRSRDRHSRSRSRERLRSRSPVFGRKLTFKEQMRKDFINASKEMVNENKALPDLTTLRKPGEALRTADLLKGVKLTGGESVTPQMALIQTMAAMHKKAQELTGVEVPKYYNPAAVNPLKYAEQFQKRKLLWSKKTEEKDKNEQMEAQWKSAFVATEDNTASKFRKLMGMKEGEGHSSTEELPEEIQKMSEERQRKHDEMFQRLDHEYQFARMTTHTQRGVGLGFSTTVIDPNHPQNPP